MSIMMGIGNGINIGLPYKAPKKTIDEILKQDNTKNLYIDLIKNFHKDHNLRIISDRVEAFLKANQGTLTQDRAKELQEALDACKEIRIENRKKENGLFQLVRHIFENVGSFFGRTKTLTKAKEVSESLSIYQQLEAQKLKCNDLANKLSSDKPELVEKNLKDIYDYLSLNYSLIFQDIKAKKQHQFSITDASGQKAHLLVTKEGQFFAFFENLQVAKGSVKFLYKGINLLTAETVVFANANRMSLKLENENPDAMTKEKDECIQSVKKECAVYRKCQKLGITGIPKMFGHVSMDIEGNTQQFLILEYFNKGDMQKILHQKKEQFTPQEKIDMAKGLAKTLTQFHENGIILRDIKAANILLKENTNGQKELAFADFDLAVKKGSNDTIGGTTDYCSPEYASALLEKKKSPATEAMDVWAFGCFLLDFFYGIQLDLEGDNNTKLQKLKSLASDPEWLSRAENFKDGKSLSKEDPLYPLLSQMLNPIADQRLSISEVLKFKIKFDKSGVVRLSKQQVRFPDKNPVTDAKGCKKYLKKTELVYTGEQLHYIKKSVYYRGTSESCYTDPKPKTQGSRPTIQVWDIDIPSPKPELTQGIED